MDRRRRRRPSSPVSSRSVGSQERLVEVRIDKVVAEGDGLGRDSSGKVVFVEGALPDELVIARVSSESKDYARARVERILEPNPRRVAPPCPHVERGCGGCDLQHASVELQIDIKREIVRESLSRIGRIVEPDVRISTRRAATVVPRTTVRVAGTDGAVGFRKRRSNDIVAIDACLVADPRINEVMAKLRLPPGSEAVIRVSGATSDVVVRTEPEENVHSNSGGLGSDVRFGANASIQETIAGVDLRVSAGSFFQSSPTAAEALVDAVARAAGPPSSWHNGPVVDAYGGVGLFAATIVPRDRHVVVIEMNPSSCSDARENLAGRDAEIVEGRVEDWAPQPACIVIADPARDGLRARAVEVLTSCEPDVFVLVSCDPASLGRDAKLLASSGFRLDYSEVLDVFPHTHHVEVVSRFVRSELVEVP